MTEFRTDPIFEAIKGPLSVIDNVERRKQLEDFVDATRLAVESSVFDLLSRFAETVDGAVSAHYDVRLHYRPGVLDLDVRPREASEPADEVWSMAEGDVEKVTIRLPAELKELATEAAAGAGLSVNSWFVRVVARALRAGDAQPESRRESRHRWHEARREHRTGHTGQRLSGWVGPEDE